MQNDPWMKHLKEQIKWILFPKPDNCMDFRVPIYLGLQAYKDCKTSKQQELPYLSWQDLLKLLEELNLTLLGTKNFHLLFLWVLVIFWNSQILFFISVTILNRYFQKHGWDWGDDLAVLPHKQEDPPPRTLVKRQEWGGSPVTPDSEDRDMGRLVRQASQETLESDWETVSKTMVKCVLDLF